MRQTDSDVKRLENWAMSMNITSEQFNTLCAIVQVTVQHKLQAFADAFMEMDILQFRKEQSEMIEEKKNKTGLWSQYA